MAFNFGQAGTGGFSFCPLKTTAAAPTGFGLHNSTPMGGGFSFGTGQPQAPTFGNPASPSQIAGLLAQPAQNNESAQGGFSLGAPAQSCFSGGGFSFGTRQPQAQSFANPTPPSQIAGLLAQPAKTKESAKGGFSFGAQVQSSFSGGGFSFGTGQPQAQAFGNPAPPSQIAGLLSQPAQNNGNTKGGFSFGAQVQNSFSGGSFSFGTGQPQAQAFANPAPPSQITGLLAQPAQNNGSAQSGFTFGAAAQSGSSSRGFSFG